MVIEIFHDLYNSFLKKEPFININLFYLKISYPDNLSTSKGRVMETTNLLMNFFSLNPLRVTLLILVSFIATIVLRFAWTNFALDSDRPRFMRWFALTVLAVILTILSNHLVLFC